MDEDIVEVTPSITAEKARELLATLGELKNGEAPAPNYDEREKSVFFFGVKIVLRGEVIRCGKGNNHDKAAIGLFNWLTKEPGVIEVISSGGTAKSYVWNGKEFIIYTPSAPQTHFVEIKKEEKEKPSLHFSLGYIREYVNLQILGKPVTKETPMGGPTDTRYHTTIPDVEFNIGKHATQVDKWREGSASNAPTDGEAFCNYFSRLIGACLIKKGDKAFRWDKEALKFAEVSPGDPDWHDLTIHDKLAHEPK